MKGIFMMAAMVLVVGTNLSMTSRIYCLDLVIAGAFCHICCRVDWQLPASWPLPCHCHFGHSVVAAGCCLFDN